MCLTGNFARHITAASRSTNVASERTLVWGERTLVLHALFRPCSLVCAHFAVTIKVQCADQYSHPVEIEKP